MKKNIIFILTLLIVGLFAVASYADWVEKAESSSNDLEWTTEIQRERIAQLKEARDGERELRLVSEFEKTTSSSEDNTEGSETVSKTILVRDDDGGGGGGGKETLGGGNEDPGNEPPQDTGLATATAVENDAVPGTVTDNPVLKMPRAN